VLCYFYFVSFRTCVSFGVCVGVGLRAFGIAVFGAVRGSNGGGFRGCGGAPLTRLLLDDMGCVDDSVLSVCARGVCV